MRNNIDARYDSESSKKSYSELNNKDKIEINTTINSNQIETINEI